MPSSSFQIKTDVVEKRVLESNPNSKLVLYQNPDSTYFVLKVVPIIKAYLLEKEFSLLREFTHSNIIQAFSFSKDQDSAYMALEYARFSDLIGFLNQFNDRICSLYRSSSAYEKFWRSLFWQITSAFTFLQQNGVAHGDIKPDNVLINENFETKVADFEYAMKFKVDSIETRMSEKYWGTPDYFSPELREKIIPYDAIKSDVFSLGVTFLNLMSKDNLFSNKETRRRMRIKRTDLVDVLQTGAQNIWGHFSLGARLSKEFKGMIEKMLAFKPEERWDFDDVLKSDWMQGERFSCEEMKKIMFS